MIKKYLEFTDSDYFIKIKPLKGAYRAVSELAKNHDLQVVTSRQESLRKKTIEWINKHFNGIFSDIHVANHPEWSVAGKTRTKIEICREIKTNILIEDGIQYAEECLEDNIPVILLDYPWNRYKTPSNTIRVKSWKEVVNCVNDFS